MPPNLAKIPPSTKLFAFESLNRSRSTQRTQEEAEKELQVLFARLGLNEGQAARIEPDLRRLLLKYCIEVPCNIRWYESARHRAERALRVARAWIVVVVVGAVIAVGGLVLINDQIVTAQIGTLLVSFFLILQVIAGSIDKKAQVGAFWKASSDLKERLYTFEHTWENRVIVDGVTSREMETALWLEITKARSITREEREAYFNTFKSPTEIVAVAAAPFEALRAQGREVATLQGQKVQVRAASAEAASKRLADARAAVMDAKARVSSAEAKVTGLTAIAAGDAEIKEAMNSVVAARAEVVRTAELARMVAKLDSQHDA